MPKSRQFFFLSIPVEHTSLNPANFFILLYNILQDKILREVNKMKLLGAIGVILMSLVFSLLLMTGLCGAASGESSVNGVAIKGYDSVAYFNAGKSMEGSESFTFQWHDMIWLFENKENRDMFAASPIKFAPQYDGYCAWAMSEAVISQSDPKIWKIVNGKLYLLCSQSAYEKWSKDIPGNIQKADEIWKELNTKNSRPSSVRDISFKPSSI
jgi:hypothetical protein